MQPGVYRYHGIEHRGTNDYGRPISVVTLEREGVKLYYAPSSLYWDLKKRSETNFIKYEGTQTSARGFEYPVFKFAGIYNKREEIKDLLTKKPPQDHTLNRLMD